MKSRAASTASSAPQIVAIGASAGGLDAFRRFFKAMPARSGLAFVLIQHLDPDHESHLAEILSKSTAMAVREASDRQPLQADCVYIIPPNRSMEVRGGKLRLTLPAQRRGLRTPIDHFLKSFANDLDEKAVCILMSSAGTDGILGLRAIKAAGGMSMVQEPGTAQFEDLPKAAVATGLADYVLPVERMPKALLAFLGHAFTGRPKTLRSASGEAEESLGRILDVVRSRTTHDFHCYKRGTLTRRIERRMGLHQVRSLKEYVSLLKRQPAEAVLLSKDLMIGFTSFFRDPPAFEELRARALPSMRRNREEGNPLRVWVPGCATGEEAYSIAMLILEEMPNGEKPDSLQVFASDIDEDALRFARAGHYPESIAVDVNPTRLKRYFTPSAQGFHVTKRLRECVVFANQNLVSAPPFSKMDLVSCRNLAIYLESDIQKRLMELFHFALNPGGLLFLGSSEGVSGREDLFRTVSKKWRIYRRMGGGRRELGSIPILPPDRAARAVREAAPANPVNLSELSRRLMMEHHAAANVVTDRRGRILHLTGATTRYLELPSGVPTLDLAAVAREGLQSRLRGAIHRAASEDRTVVLDRENVKRDDRYHSVRVTVAPVKSPLAAEGLLHVVFEEAPDPPAATQAHAAPGEAGNDVLRRLEGELQSTRDELQHTIEDLEASNVELKVANEEVLSSNEELQSSNEELETSKEELQTLNEELSTVNSQLQEKVQELTDSTNDLANLLSSTEIATVFLDTRFRVKRFTPPGGRLLNLIPSDVGRPVRHLVSNLVAVNLIEDAQAVLRKLVPIQRQVRSRRGASYVMRVLPYRTTGNVIEGVVFTFSDVSELADREQLLKDREKRQRIIVDLGHRALARHPVDQLLNLAVRCVQGTLRADLGDVLRLDEDRKRFRLWAGAGWKKAKPGLSEIAVIRSSAAATAVRTRTTVFVDAVPSPRLKLTPLQRAERVTSCLYSVISNSNGPLGLLGAHSRKKRAFTHEDGLFLQDLAGILGNAIARERVESELKGVRQFLKARVEERTKWLATSRDVSRAANRAESVTEVMERALMALCSGSGWKFGHVFMLSSWKPHRPIYRCGWYPKGSERFLPFRDVSRATLAGVRSLPSRVLRVTKPLWMSEERPASAEGGGQAFAASDRLSTSTVPLKQLIPLRYPLARRLGIVSAAAVPVKAGSENVGVLEVFSDKSMPPSRPMLDMMEQVALEIGRTYERVESHDRTAAALWNEQRSIGQELHDSIGQELTGLGAMSESLLNTLHRKGRVDASRLRRLTQGLQRTLERLRNVTHGLIPLEVDSNGLATALARLAKLTQARFGVRCVLAGSSSVRLRSREEATHLYRIAQESITNAVRHGGARRIRLRLRKDARTISLTIQDDGRGLMARHPKEGLGLQIMRYRAQAIGGRLILRSRRNKGTQVVCMLNRGDGR